MAITRTQQAKQLLKKRIPFYAGGYSDSRDDPGGAHQQSMSSNDNGGGGGIGSDRAASARAAAARASAARAKEDRDRQEQEQKIINNAVKQAEENPFGKTFVNRGYVNPSTFDVRAAANRPPPGIDDEDDNKSFLDKTIGVAKGTAKNLAIGQGLGLLGISNPFGLAALAISKMFGMAKENKAKKDAIQDNFNKAQFSNSFYAGATPPSLSPTRGPTGPSGGDGDNDFPLIQPPSVIQQQEVIEEEPTPYDFDVYAARDNRVARRFAQGGRTGFNMGGMEEENLQAGAPDLRLEGNQVPQQEEMASAPGIDAELYQLFLDALRKGDVPRGTTFDAYKQLMMQAMSEQQGGQMQEEMMQPEMQEGIMQAQMMEPEREMAAFGGMMGSDGRRAYGIGSFFKKAARKAKRAVKKVLKSNIGKAALAGAALYFAPAAAKRFGNYTKGGKNFASVLGGGKRMDAFKMLMPGGRGLDGLTKGQRLAELTKQAKDEAIFFDSTIPKEASPMERFTANRDFIKEQAAKQAIPAKSFFGSDLSKTIASIGIPAAMGLVYKQGKVDERPMDENTLARIDQYNNPLFEEGIGGRRARILAGDNTGMSFVGPDSIYAANGGRIGYQDAGPVRPEINTDQIEMLIKKGADNDLIKTFVDGALDNDINQIRDQVNNIMRNNKAQGGLMNLGGNEMDLRGGGFVPLGAKEKADDVPARLSKNEFVFTADAVRAAGGGSVDKGAEKMYNTMKRLEGVMA